MNTALDSRARFEATFALAPYEFDMARWPANSTKTAWPGNYKFYHVQCAWEAWQAAIASMAAPVAQPARALAEWHEDDGPVLWWAWNGHGWAGEPAWAGTPLSSDWPGYHTHWTPHPPIPPIAALAAKETPQ